MRAGPPSAAEPSVTTIAPRGSAGGANATLVDHGDEPLPNEAWPDAAEKRVPIVATSTRIASSTPYDGPVTVSGELTCAAGVGEETLRLPLGSAAPVTSQALPKRWSCTVVTFTGCFDVPSVM